MPDDATGVATHSSKQQPSIICIIIKFIIQLDLPADIGRKPAGSFALLLCN